MDFQPFPIPCTTCGAKLVVRNPKLIGQVLACPKCSSMVFIEQPGKKIRDAAAEEGNAAATPAIEKTDKIDVFSQVENSSDPTTRILSEHPTTKNRIPPTVLPPPIPIVDPVVGKESEEPIIRRRNVHDRERSVRFKLLVSFISIAVLLGLAFVAILHKNQELAQDEPNHPVGQSVEPGPDPGNNESVPITDPLHQDDSTENPTVDLPDSVETEPGEEEPGVFSDENLSPEGIGPESERAEHPEVPDPEREQSIQKTPNLNPQPIKAREKIDITERLKLPISALKIEGASLLDCVQMLSDFSGIPISIDVPQMRSHAISVKDPLHLELGESTVADVFTTLVRNTRLSFQVESYRISLLPGNSGDQVLREVRYDISDIVFGIAETGKSDRSFTTGELACRIPSLISPFSWSSRGGNGSIRVEESTLLIEQTEPIHREILRFFELVRSTRGIPMKTDIRAELLSPERSGWENLTKPFTLHYYRAVPLPELLDSVEGFTGLKILVDHEALENYGLSVSDLSATVNAERGTIDDALEQLLSSVEPVDLTYRIVDSDILEITTLEKAFQVEKYTLESHDYGGMLKSQSESMSVEEVINTLKNSIIPQSWSEQTGGGGAVFVDRSTQTLYVRQSQPAQRTIRKWLQVFPSQSATTTTDRERR